MRSHGASLGLAVLLAAVAFASPAFAADRQPPTIAGLQADLLNEGQFAQVLDRISEAQTDGLSDTQIAHALGRTAYSDQARLEFYREGLIQLAGQGLEEEFEAGWRSEVALRDQRGLTFPPLGGYGGSEGGRNQ